jgi:teichuronic acid exporter
VKLSEKKNEPALNSYRLSALNIFFKTIPTIIVPIILARILTPEIFGLVAISGVFVGLAQFITTFETGESIIKNELNQSILHSIFWFNVACGLSLYLILFLTAEIFSSFFNDAVLKTLIKVQAIILVITSLTTVPQALLRKKLDFYSLSIASLVAGIFSSIISISLALLDYGIWSLVSFYLIQQIIFLIMIIIKSKYIPKFIFKFYDIKNIFSFSANLTLTKILSFIERNITKIIIGKHLGHVQVGLFNLSNMIVVKPIKTVSQFINPVFYSLASKKKEMIKENLASNYLMYIQICALIFYPIAIILFFFSEEIILLILGEKWKGMIPIVIIFSFLLYSRPFTKITREIYKTLSLTDVILKIYLVFTVLFITLILYTVQFGLEIIAISTVIANYFLTFMLSVFLMNKLQLSFIKIIKNIKYILISNCILVVYYTIFLWAISINSNLQTWYFKFAILFSGGFLYLFLQFMFPSNAFNLIKDFTRINETFTHIKNFLKISNKVR